MYVGLYQGAAAMNGLEEWQAHISQNIANSSVPGYKASVVAMEGENKGPNPSSFADVLSNTMVKADAETSFSNGQYIPSDDPLDLAVGGTGFFQLRAPDGSLLLTRNGRFHVDSQNRLVGQDNLAVMSTTGEIQLTPGGGKPLIDAGGRVTQNGVQVAQIEVVTVANQNALQPANGGFMTRVGSNPGIEVAQDPQVLQGFYESSNISPVNEMVNLISVSRAYEANQKVIQAHDRLLERATQTFAP